MSKGIVALLIVCIMILSGLTGIYTMSTLYYNDYLREGMPIYDFTRSMQEGLMLFKTIGDAAGNLTASWARFTPYSMYLVQYDKYVQNETGVKHVFLIIWAPQDEDFENLTWNCYYRIYAVSSNDPNLIKICNEWKYCYIVPYYQNMTSRWWWICDGGTTTETSKLSFTYSGLTEGSGIESTPSLTYNFVSCTKIDSAEISKLQYTLVE